MHKEAAECCTELLHYIWLYWAEAFIQSDSWKQFIETVFYSLWRKSGNPCTPVTHFLCIKHIGIYAIDYNYVVFFYIFDIHCFKTFFRHTIYYVVFVYLSTYNTTLFLSNVSTHYTMSFFDLLYYVVSSNLFNILYNVVIFKVSRFFGYFWRTILYRSFRIYWHTVYCVFFFYILYSIV